jgi:hypothetical protein
MTDSFDFPAAHSMDTTWFAVDRDGNVAVFVSGEAGAVPQDAYLADEAYGHMDRLHAIIEPRPMQYVLAGRRRDHKLGTYAPDWKALVFVESREVADRLVASGGTEVPCKDAFAVVVADPARSVELQRLHADGECLACDDHIEGEDSEYAADLAKRGLYVYEHIDDTLEVSAVAGPYGLQAQPRRPLKLAEIPAPFPQDLVVFAGSFEDTPRLQPAEHWHSVAWGPSFASVDQRRIAPLPDRMKDYREEYNELFDPCAVKGIELETPFATTPGKREKKPWWRFW